MEIDRDQLLFHVTALAEGLRDINALRMAEAADYNSKKARISLLIEDRRVIELDDGLLQYQLNTPIKNEAGIVISVMTFMKPTVRLIRTAAPYAGDEWAAIVIKKLCKEVSDDATLNRIDGAEWDAIVEVVRFPFLFAPIRVGPIPESDDPTSSGGAS